MARPAHRERRAFFRLRYPLSCRPVLVLSSGRCLVTELSEGGLRLLGPRRLAIGQRLHGVIRFGDGGRTRIAGVVIREQGPETVIRTAPGVSCQRMVHEQRRLLARFPLLHVT